MYDIIIIGGGAAGLTAAIYAERAGLKAVIFEKLFLGGQTATTYTVENYPGFAQISGPDLMLKMESHAKKFGTEVINEEVSDIVIDDHIKKVITAKNAYESRTIIITTGAKPKSLNIKGEKEFYGRGASYCATCDGAFYKNEDVAVVGGGNTAVEDAIFLSRFCNKVYLIHRRDALRADKSLQEQVESIKNVEMIFNSVPVEIIGEDSINNFKIKDVVTGEQKTLDLKGIFVAIGVIPNSNLAEGKVEVNKQGYIITNDKMETNRKGVFAAGDARDTPLRQIVTAASDGAIAAYYASVYIAQTSNISI